MILREYDPARDREAAQRIWHEVGWFDKGKEEEEGLDRYIGCGRAFVAELHGEAECLVLTAPGTIRYLDEDLSFFGLTGVTTSRVARKQGLAGRLVAKAIATDAAAGRLVSGLSMFEQGYYNQVGFGTGAYENLVGFDPALLEVRVRARAPRRIRPEDWEIAHAARLARHRGHGGCNFFSPVLTRGEMEGDKNKFGLGYFDGPGGELTHYFWCGTREREHGPYRIEWMVYRTWEQFLELMALIKNQGDQVRLVEIQEPAGIQIQDLIRQPFKHHAVTKKSPFEAYSRAVAFGQMRICDLPGCLAKTRLRGEAVRFHLSLTDPIERFLEDSSSWRGVGGDYIVTLGPESSAERGTDATLPTLTASVNAFTRMWFGVLSASSLAVTDTLSGPPELLERLDWALRLPAPKPDWEF